MAKFLFVLAVASPSLFAETLFEGYSKIKAKGETIGYIIQRFDLDKDKKEFSTVSYTRLNEKNGNTSESLKAFCSDSFRPKSYSYTFQSGETTKTIDANFEKGFMSLKISNGKKTENKKIAIQKETFLSSFLGYLMLQDGYKVGKNFVYQAVAEEDGTIESGKASIVKEEKWHGQPAFKINNKFKKVEFVSLVSSRGEIVHTESPEQGLETELVKESIEATAGMPVPTSTLKLLFGKIPEGKKNLLH